MSGFSAISAALDGHLETFASASSLGVAWENNSFTPVTGETYLRATQLPGNTEPTGGENASDSHVGIYQTDVVTSVDTGKLDANTKADLIADHFKRGTLLDSSGVCVKVTAVSIGSGGRDGPYFIQPVFITYRSYTAAR